MFRHRVPGPRHSAVLMRASAVAAVIVVSGLATSGQSQDAGPLRVEHRGGPFVPGDVVWLSVTSEAPVSGLSGVAFDRPIRFWPADVNSWRALVAIGLETAPGAHRVSIRATREAAAWEEHLQWDVQKKEFETRRLSVSGRFVEPPASEAERIAREAETVAAIYARTDTERLWRGAFVMPVPGRPTSSFGRLSVYNGQPRGRHQGADFAAAAGTPVRAPNAGRVALAADLFFSGNTVILDHGAGLYSVFAHLSRMAVAEGTTVHTNDLLGEAGATGRVTGPHLHWAIRLGETSVDPLSLMTAAAEIPDLPESVVSR